MRFAKLGLCVFPLVVAGCARSTPAADEGSTPPKPAAVVEKPAAVPVPAPAVVAAASLGEDEDGKAVFAPDLDAIKTSLKNPNPSVRRTAVQGLAKVRWKAAEPAGTVLASALSDADPGVRLAAAGALLARGQHAQDVHSALAAILKDRQAERRAVLELLRTHAAAARPAMPELVALALDAKDPLRVEAIAVLGQLDPAQESVDALLLTAHDAEPQARAAALRALGRLDPMSAKVQATLVKALRDPNVAMARAAAEGAGRAGVPALVDLLRHGDENLRDAAVRALGRIGPDANIAVAELTRLAQSDPAERIRQSARAALKTIAPQ